MYYALCQKKIYKGYGKAAKRLGTSYNIYRSTTGIDPIVSGNLKGTILMSPNVEWTYMKANKYGNSVWQLLVDGSTLKVGDYLVGESTFFVIGMQPLLPIIGVKCDRIITITEPNANLAAGDIPYGGYTKDNVAVVMQNCPCSFLLATKGEKPNAKIPTDTKLPWFYVYIPYLNATIKTGHVITDQNNVSYIVDGDEKTELGWKLLVMEMGV
jgi:hypothetical protein